MESRLGTKKTFLLDGKMYLSLNMVLRKLLKQEECWGRRDSVSILLTLPCCKGLLKPTIPSLTNSIYLGFLTISTGDLMRGITEPWRVSIRQRHLKSMARIKFSFGEDLMIFLLLSSLLMMRDIQDSLHNIQIYQQTLFLALSRSKSLLTECFPSGTTPFAQQFWTIRT